MHMKSKSMIALVLVVITMATMFVPAMAINTTGQTPVSLTSEAAIFNVTIPTVLPVNADEQGNISVSNDIRITNSSWGPIYIAGIAVSSQNSWAIADYDASTMYSEKVGTQKIAMVINNCKTTAAGAISYAPENFPRLEGRGGSNWIGINYNAKLPAQNTTLNKVVPMNVMFTVAWLTASSPSTIPSNSNTESYNLALSSTPEALSVGEESSLTAIQDKGTIDWSSSNTGAVEVVPVTSGSLFSFLPFILTATAAENSTKSTVNLKAVGVGMATIAATNEVGDKVTREVSVVQTADGFKIESMPIKTSYKEGESFNPAGLVIKDISSGTQITKVNCDVVSIAHGQRTINVWYMDNGTKKTITLPIIFKEKTLVSIKATSGPDKTQYFTGQVFDNTGMVITAFYDDHSSEIITNYSYATGQLINEQVSVPLSYNGKTCNVPITVKDKSLISIRATAAPTVTQYVTGDKFVPNGMIVKAYYDDGSQYTITGYTYPTTAFVGGETSVTIAYNGKTCLVPIAVSAIAPVPTNVTDYYVYTNDVAATGGYKVSLNSDFKAALMSNVAYKAWKPGQPLPNPGSVYNGIQVTSMNQLFYCAQNIVSLNLSYFDTRNVKDMSQMFGYCYGLASLNMSSFNTANVTNMSNMFSNTNQLTSLDLTMFDTSKVTSMNSMFYYSTNLSSINLSTFNTSNVTDTGGMFSQCKSLRNIDISNFNTANVTNMAQMFSYSAITQLNLSNFNTCKVTNMSGMFSGAHATILDLSSFDTTKVTDMSNMFSVCIARTGYARNATDANKFNNWSLYISKTWIYTSRPSGLVFVMKP